MDSSTRKFLEKAIARLERAYKELRDGADNGEDFNSALNRMVVENELSDYQAEEFKERYEKENT